MKTLLRLLIYLITFIIVFVLAGGTALYTMAQRTLPQTAGQIVLPGVSDRVEVIRDAWGVPHIYAQNKDDLFFAQGYVTAQDRLWQLEFNRRVAAGRLSEFGGESTLSTDLYLRTIGLRRSAEQDVANLTPAQRASLEAYARGVNAFIDSHRSSLPLEYVVLNTLGGARIAPEPWTPVDSVGLGKVLSMGLTGSSGYEIFRYQARALLGAERQTELEPGYPADGPFIIKGQTASAAAGQPASDPPGVDPALAPALAELAQQAARARALALFGSLDAAGAALGLAGMSGIGSNNWVVDGAKSASGRPLLANDPHLGIQNPSIWYEVHLEAPGLRLAGVTFIGMPGIVLGHNDRIAWGATNTGADVQDLFIEKFNPQNPRQYQTENGWAEAAVLHEEFRVKGQAEPVVKEILVTRHGPIVTDVVKGISERVALRWTANDPGRLVGAVMSLWTARNWQDFRAALQDWDVPSQNLVYADVDGNIGYQMPGRVPLRAKGDGALPAPGWAGEYDWKGWIPYDDLPRVYNPATHYVATANNQIMDNTYPYRLANEWAPPYRAERIESLLHAVDKLSSQDMSAIQADVYSLPDKELAPYILALALPPENDVQRRAAAAIQSWDGRLTRESAAAAIMEATMVAAVRNTFSDELGSLAADYQSMGVPVLLRLLPDGGNQWFDDRATPAREGRDDILRRSFTEALDSLRGMMGKDMATWRWDRIHTATFKHQALGGIGLLAPLFNIGPLPLGGGGNSATVYSASYNFAKPYGVTSLSSMRAIYDLSNFDNSLMVNTLGQSGQPFAKHYGDMIEDWRDLNYHTMPFSRQAVEQAQTGLLILSPE